MDKGYWYKFLFHRIDEAISKEFYFEAAFIYYGIIEDRLNSLMRKNGLEYQNIGVAKKIKALAKERNEKAENILLFKNWDGGKYQDWGALKDVFAWGILYRNPMQHFLGDPCEYHGSIGAFHNEHTKDLAIQGKEICRDLAALVMRYNKQ